MTPQTCKCTHTHRNLLRPCEDRPVPLHLTVLAIIVKLSTHARAHTLPTGPVHLSGRWHLQMNYGRWLSSSPGSHARWRNPGCGLPVPTLSHVSHFRGWKPQRGTRTTSIKPPLILIHFVVSRELLLIKCVPDCIMGVSRGLLHEANSPRYSHQTLGWTGPKS